MCVCVFISVCVCMFVSVCVCVWEDHWGLLAQASIPAPNLVTLVGLAENGKVMAGGHTWGRNPGNHLAHRSAIYSTVLPRGRAKPNKRSHKPEKTGFRKHRV